MLVSPADDLPISLGDGLLVGRGEEDGARDHGHEGEDPQSAESARGHRFAQYDGSRGDRQGIGQEGGETGNGQGTAALVAELE